MRYPTPQDVAPLVGKSVDWFVRWLRIGLAEFLLERKGREAFPEVRNFVDQGEGNIASDLQRIFETLPTREQETFKEAVAKLMQALDYTKAAHEAVAISLLELGVGIGAQALLRVLARKSFCMSPDHGGKLYDLAFELSAQLADLEPDETVSCLKHLIGHKDMFKPQLAGRALIALTQARPDGFAEHFRSLGPMLDAKYGYVLDDGNAEEERRGNARTRLLRALSRRAPDKTVFALVFNQHENQFVWWLDSLAAEMPDVLAQAVHASDPEPEAVSLAAERPPASGIQNISVVLAEVRSVLTEVWQTVGRRPKTDTGDRSAFRFAHTAEVELAVAIGDLGNTRPLRPSDKRSTYESDFERQGA